MSNKLKSKNNSSRNFSTPQHTTSSTHNLQKSNTPKENSDLSKSFSPSSHQKYRSAGTTPNQKVTQTTPTHAGDAGLTQTREQMIQRYLALADQYREELKRRDQLREEQRSVQAGIASIFIQGDRIDELIKKVKETQQPESTDENL